MLLAENWTYILINDRIRQIFIQKGCDCWLADALWQYVQTFLYSLGNYFPIPKGLMYSWLPKWHSCARFRSCATSHSPLAPYPCKSLMFTFSLQSKSSHSLDVTIVQQWACKGDSVFGFFITLQINLFDIAFYSCNNCWQFWMRSRHRQSTCLWQ